MKKITILLSLLIASNTFAQDKVESFEITPDGINGFVVKEFPGKSVEELFISVKKWAEYQIENATKSNQSELENEYLKYDLRIGNVLGMMNNMWYLDVSVAFRFKPDKVRIDIIYNTMPNVNPGGPPLELRGGIVGWSLFTSNGKPRNYSKKSVVEINTLLNTIPAGVENYILGKDKNVSKDW